MEAVAVEVSGITGCAPYQGYVVILKEQQGNKWLPIFIGGPEAHNISLLLQGLKYIRPLTYDLFANLIDSTGAKIEKVTVTDLRDNTFFAEVSLRIDSGTIQGVDARPSDAIALAIKTKAPIFVNTRVMNEAGLVGELSTAQNEADNRLKDLNSQLDEAVQQEAYEEAAKIRDQIKALEGSFHSG